MEVTAIFSAVIALAMAIVTLLVLQRRSSVRLITMPPEEAIMLSTAAIRAYIPVYDVSRARKFYEETLGLKPKQEFADGVIYECGGAEVFMYPTPNAGTSKASQAFWQVDDVEAEVADLKARACVREYNMPGISMKNSIATAGGAKTAWFKEPKEISWRSAKLCRARLTESEAH